MKASSTLAVFPLLVVLLSVLPAEATLTLTLLPTLSLDADRLYTEPRGRKSALGLKKKTGIVSPYES